MGKVKAFLEEFNSGLGVVFHIGSLLAMIVTAAVMWTKMDYTVKTLEQSQALQDSRVEKIDSRVWKVEKWVLQTDKAAQVGP